MPSSPQMRPALLWETAAPPLAHKQAAIARCLQIVRTLDRHVNAGVSRPPPSGGEPMINLPF